MMKNPHLVFHHFGVAVRRPDEAREFVISLGYQLNEAVFDPAQNVHLQLCTHPQSPAVEIIWPGDTSGPIDKLVQRHASGIIYHVCYETGDLAVALAGLQTAGLTPICISPPKPAPLFGGRPVSFYNLIGIGLIEILE
jgi:Glyoxalase/Bleomycin resistance protein/Dioxygenase superfamily